MDQFHDLYDIPLVIIETTSGESFTANKRGTIRIAIISDSLFDLPDIPIMLIDVIYVDTYNTHAYTLVPGIAKWALRSRILMAGTYMRGILFNLNVLMFSFLVILR